MREGLSFSTEDLGEVVSGGETFRFYLQYLCGSPDTLVASFLISVMVIVNKICEDLFCVISTSPQLYTYLFLLSPGCFDNSFVVLPHVQWVHTQRGFWLWDSLNQWGRGGNQGTCAHPLSFHVGTILRRSYHQTFISAMF